MPARCLPSERGVAPAQTLTPIIASQRDARLRSHPAQITANALQKRIFVLNITFGRLGLGQLLWPESGFNRIHKGSVRPMRPLRQLDPRLRRGRNAKAIRVTAISTDQLVPCPNCSEPMRLSDAQKFVCAQCGYTVDIEGILKSLDVGA